MLGHMAKMATMPIYGENSSNFYFTRTGVPISSKLGTWHRGLLLIKVCSYVDPGMTLTYFTSSSNLVISVFLSENEKIGEISETFAASCLKICRCRQLIQ